MSHMDLQLSKATLRTSMRKHPHASPEESLAVGEAVTRFLSSLPTQSRIAAYAALPGEVDLSTCIKAKPSSSWYFPRVLHDTLAFFEVLCPETDLETGAFGIKEPKTHLSQIHPSKIDVFLCPGLAFDPQLGRLGRGRGFYDRVLSSAKPSAVKIGVGFDHQIVADTFSEAHDIRMDFIICASAVYSPDA
jgi:5-formyltetrahydrofolate cyclo-ligase